MAATKELKLIVSRDIPNDGNEIKRIHSSTREEREGPEGIHLIYKHQPITTGETSNEGVEFRTAHNLERSSAGECDNCALPSDEPDDQDDVWMSLPEHIPDCPPGLENLINIDFLRVYQWLDFWQAIRIQTKAKFKVKNRARQKVFFAEDQTNFLFRNCCFNLAPYGIKIMDRFKNEVIHLKRSLICDFGCPSFCLQKMQVCAPPEHLLGTVEQEWTFSRPLFQIKDSTGEHVLTIKGPSCVCSSCGDPEFQILSADEQSVMGRIYAHWYDVYNPASDLNHFGIYFPMDMDVGKKALILGASFLMSSLFYKY